MSKDHSTKFTSIISSFFSACFPSQKKDENPSPQSTPYGSFRGGFEEDARSNFNPNLVHGCFSDVVNAIETRREERNVTKELDSDQRARLLDEVNRHNKAHPTRGFDITMWIPVINPPNYGHPSGSTAVKHHYRLQPERVDEITFI